MRPIDVIFRCGGVVQNTVRKFDLFSQRIMFTYKGDSSFSTFLGGFVSLIIFTVIGVYSAFLVQVMINRSNSNNSLSTEVVDLTTNDENYYPTNYGFAFGVAFTDAWGNPLTLDPTYFTLSIVQNTVVNDNGVYKIKGTDLGAKLCDSTDFPNLSSQYKSRSLNSALYCPVNKNYKLAGNYLANNYQFIGIFLNRCKGTNWKPTALINSLIPGITANVAILNSYMDFNDYSNPVKSYFDDRASFYLLTAYAKVAKIYAKLNKAVLDDDYLKLKSTTTKEFFSVDRISNDVATFDYDVVAEVGILLDPNRDTYHRTVFTILDLFGTLGGIFGLLTSACGAIIGIMTTQIMLSSVFRRLYYTNKLNFDSLAIKIMDRSRKIASVLVEEDKQPDKKNNKSYTTKLKYDDSKSYSDIDVRLDDNNQTSEINKTNDEFVLHKLRTALKYRKKYQANCVHKWLTFIPSCMWPYKGILKK